jgi:hypothetical protein
VQWSGLFGMKFAWDVPSAFSINAFQERTATIEAFGSSCHREGQFAYAK